MKQWWVKSKEELGHSRVQVARDAKHLFGTPTMSEHLNSSGYLAVNLVIAGNPPGKDYTKYCLWDKKHFFKANKQYKGDAYTIGEVTGIRVGDTFHLLLDGKLLRTRTLLAIEQRQPIYDLVLEAVENLRDYEDHIALL